MEHIFFKQIIPHCVHYDILTDIQYGFIKNRSCVFQFFSFIADLAYYTGQGCQTDIILLDFQEGFNAVLQKCQLANQDHHNIRSPILAWLKCFLSQGTQKVLTEDHNQYQ